MNPDEPIIPLAWKLNLWLGLGIPLSIGWLLLVAIFVRPQTQRYRHLAWWVLPVVALGVVAPLVWKFALWLDHAAQPALYAISRLTETLASLWWIVPVALAVAALGFVVMWHVRSRGQSASPVGPVAAPSSSRPAHLEVAAPAQPAAIWSLPAEHRTGNL